MTSAPPEERGEFRLAAAEAASGHPFGFFSPLLNVKATKAVKGVSVERRALTNGNCLKERSAKNRDLGPIYSILVVLIWERVCKKGTLHSSESYRNAFSPTHLPPQDPLVLRIPTPSPQQLDCLHYLSPGKYARIQPPRPNRGVPGQLPGVGVEP